jgi:WD40 repeat protein
MDLSIRNYVLSKQFISKIAFNSTHNILAAIVDAADTIAFYHCHPQLHTIQEIFQGTSKPSGKKTSLAWSNDGQYLALGSGQLELWKFDGKKILPVKTYTEDFIDIKLIAWSPDSLSLAYGGLCKKNTVKIRHL